MQVLPKLFTFPNVMKFQKCLFDPFKSTETRIADETQKGKEKKPL